MAIRKIRICTDFGFAELLSFLTAENFELQVVVPEIDKPPKAPNELQTHRQSELLERSERTRANGLSTGLEALLAHFASHKGKSFRYVELGEVLESIGQNPKSASPQIAKLRKSGYVRRGARGRYVATAKGIAHYERRVAGRD